jgi:hypothetical protein
MQKLLTVPLWHLAYYRLPIIVQASFAPRAPRYVTAVLYKDGLKAKLTRKFASAHGINRDVSVEAVVQAAVFW